MLTSSEVAAARRSRDRAWAVAVCAVVALACVLVLGCAPEDPHVTSGIDCTPACTGKECSVDACCQWDADGVDCWYDSSDGRSWACAGPYDCERAASVAVARCGCM